MNPLDKIQSYYDDFTKTDIDIANYIKQYPQEVINQSIDTIAQNTNSSKAAIVRFTKKIGYQGYAEFRFELSRYLTSQIHEQTDKKEAISPIISIPNIYSDIILSLQNTISLEQTKRITKLIRHARRLKIIGTNRTFLSARQLKQRLGTLGFDAEAIGDTSDMSDASEMATEKDLFILFTVRGKGNYANLVHALHKKNCPVVVLTMTPQLPYLKECSEYVLLPRVDQSPSSPFLDNHPLFFIYIEILLKILNG